MKAGEPGDILRYIQNEKDISRYRLSFLEKNKAPSASQKRIISIEKEFLDLPLESMLFEDVADVAAAISIYRSSRQQFYDTYKIPNPDFAAFDKAGLLDLINKKTSFLKDLGLSYQTIKVEESNPLQNSDFYYEIVKRQSMKTGNSFDVEKKILDGKKLKDLLDLEPSVLAKKRARVQAALYSIGRYISDSIPTTIPDRIDLLKKMDLYLDSIVENIESNIFGFYNQALNILPNSVAGTMGENIALSKMHKIQNVLDFKNLDNRDFNFKPISNHGSFSCETPMVGNLFYGHKKIVAISPNKDAERKIQNKVFGILLPIPRESNEKMTLLYKKIIIDDKEVSHLFSNEFSNVKATSGCGNIYYKAILMHPFWMLKNMCDKDPSSCGIILKLLGLQDIDYKNINFEDKDVIDRINDNDSGFINICSKSRVLSAKTRSEDEGISEVFSIINSKILEIKEEYNFLSTRG